MSMYGITHEQWLELYEAQDGVCAICREPERRVLYGQVAHLVVDHNHETNMLRALLCHRCNTRLGTVEDFAFVAQAVAYLVAHGTPRAQVQQLIEELQRLLTEEKHDELGREAPTRSTSSADAGPQLPLAEL